MFQVSLPFTMVFSRSISTYYGMDYLTVIPVVELSISVDVSIPVDVMVEVSISVTVDNVVRLVVVPFVVNVVLVKISGWRICWF